MATFAVNPELETRLTARERAAWAMYKDSLEDLDGEAYDDAEIVSWARLQDALRQIEADRADAAAGDS
jgi:ABC-type amino acid transport substrate-binding protein